LLAAVTAQRAEYVAGKALRVNPDQWRAGEDIAHHQCDRFFYGLVMVSADTSLKAENSELAPAGRKLRRRYLACG